jgi:hypothetical protein
MRRASRVVAVLALATASGVAAAAEARLSPDDYVELAEKTGQVVECLSAEVSPAVLDRFDSITSLIGAGKLDDFRRDAALAVGADKVEALRAGAARDDASEEAVALMRLLVESAQADMADDAPMDRKLVAVGTFAVATRYLALATTTKCGREPRFLELMQRAIATRPPAQ